LLLELGLNEVIFFPDNDKAGLKARDEICPQITQWIPTYYVPEATIPEGKDVGDMSREEIEYCLENKRKWE
jgi:DNA primase